MTEKKDRAAAKRLSTPVMILTDVFCVIAGLLLFALFHHVLRFGTEIEPVILEPVVCAETESPVSAAALPSEAALDPLLTEEAHAMSWREKFAEHFTEGEVEATDTSYRSANVSVTLDEVVREGLIYRVADIYIADLNCLQVSLGGGEFGGGKQPVTELGQQLNAIVTLSGDYYSARQEGVVVRNGVLYRETRFGDVGILGFDGVLRTVTDRELDLKALREDGAWQVWSFGPQLLEDGQVMTEFNSDVTRRNPRSAIGYYEPGHYCFVQVDGRITASHGMSMEELSQLFYDLGCTAAYNLDGGQTSGMAWQGELLSYPYGRNVSDALCIVDIGEDE